MHVTGSLCWRKRLRWRYCLCPTCVCLNWNFKLKNLMTRLGNLWGHRAYTKRDCLFSVHSCWESDGSCVAVAFPTRMYWRLLTRVTVCDSYLNADEMSVNWQKKIVHYDHDGIWTHNLLISSRTRYHCATGTLKSDAPISSLVHRASWYDEKTMWFVVRLW